MLSFILILSVFLIFTTTYALYLIKQKNKLQKAIIINKTKKLNQSRIKINSLRILAIEHIGLINKKFAIQNSLYKLNILMIDYSDSLSKCHKDIKNFSKLEEKISSLELRINNEISSLTKSLFALINEITPACNFEKSKKKTSLYTIRTIAVANG